jgi:hypothetical protein
MPRLRRRILLLLAFLTLPGCTAPLQQGRAPIASARMSPDSVALDMFFVRCPFGDPTINEKVWKEIDEQQFAPELRERLAGNGFRVGVICGQIPGELLKLMELSDKPASTGDIEGSQVASLEAEPRVVQRHLQIRAGEPGTIIASGIYAELPVLVSRLGKVSGQTYNQAQGIFAIRSLPQPDGRVRLELLPELHHDQPRMRYVGNQGVLRLDTSRPKEVYSDMTITTDLPAGAMLVLSSLANRPGSLGHYFFTSGESRLEQKLLIVRLSQTQHDGLFNPPEPFKLEQ